MFSWIMIMNSVHKWTAQRNWWPQIVGIKKLKRPQNIICIAISRPHRLYVVATTVQIAIIYYLHPTDLCAYFSTLIYRNWWAQYILFYILVTKINDSRIKVMKRMDIKITYQIEKKIMAMSTLYGGDYMISL